MIYNIFPIPEVAFIAVRTICVGYVTLFFSLFVQAQTEKKYVVPIEENAETMNLRVNIPTGKSVLSAAHNPSPLKIYTTIHNPNEVEATFTHSNANLRFQTATFQVNDKSTFLLDNSLSNKNLWNFFFNHKTKYRLDLNFGMGETHINMSDMEIAQMSIKSGKANITLNYQTAQNNRSQMDSFLLKMEFGEVIFKKVDLARIKYLKADIGMGHLILEYGANLHELSTVKVKVGAGSLDLVLPDTEKHILIKINGSSFSKLRLPPTFIAKKEGYYQNSEFADNTEVIVFDIDVSMGSVQVKLK